MITNTEHAWGWAVLFGILAASNVARLLLGAGHAPDLALAAIGFSVVALVAVYRPRGFLVVSWRQLSAPRKLGTLNVVSMAAVALLVVGTAVQWFVG